MYCTHRLLKINLPILIGWLLFGATNLYAFSWQIDSLVEPIVELEFNIQKLRFELDQHFDQMDYLKDQITEYSTRLEIKKLKELIEIKQKEIDVLNHRILLNNILLSKARRIEFYPLQQRQVLNTKIIEESKSLNKRKIILSEVHSSKLSERMKYNLYPVEFMYDCETKYFPTSKLTGTKRETLLSYTPTEIEGHLNAIDFLTADVAILKSGKKIYLDLRLIFNTTKAGQIYGLLEASQAIRLEFMDGTYIYLNAANSSTGEINHSLNQCIYQLQFPLDDFSLQELKKNHADKLIVIWEKGKEIFEIYQIDIIQKLLKCLNP